jgi:hypothetical protein
MKTIAIARTGLILLSMLHWINVSAQIKTAILGNYSNGQAVITDMTRSKEVLMGSLPATAVLSDIHILYVETERAYYLTAKVANDPIRFIAIEMKLDGNLLSISSGPGYEMLCQGNRCNDCVSKTPKGKETCYCANSSSDEACFSVSGTTIKF